MQKPLGQYRAVDVAIDKVHQHFGARARGEQGAPVGASHALGHTHPGAAAGITWGMAGGLDAHDVGAAQAAVDRGHASLPGELDAHAAIAVGGAHSQDRLTSPVVAPFRHTFFLGQRGFLLPADRLKHHLKLIVET